MVMRDYMKSVPINLIRRVFAGERKTAKGFIFKEVTV